MRPQARMSVWVLAAGVLLAAAAGAVTAMSPFVHSGVTVAVVAVSVLLPFAVAAELRARYPGRVLAMLLIAIGVAYFVRALAAIDSSLTYAPARALGQFSEVLLVWLMLAFPSGRLSRPWGRAIVIAGALSIVLLWWPTIGYSPHIPAGSLFVPCGNDCPANSLLVVHQPATGETLELLFRGFGVMILLATAVVLTLRLRRASSVMRRVLAPVLIASILRTAAVAAYLALGSVPPVKALLVLSYLGVPIGIIIGLVRGRAYDAAALERLVRGLRTRPGPAQLRTVMAQALEDPTLQIAYWIEEAGAYAGEDGLPVDIPDDDASRAVTRVAGPDGEPVAALTHDPALLDHPELLEALSSTASLALETNGLEAAVAAARAGTITAVDAERRRIERDLHDGTQQRLIALRMKLSVAERILGDDAGRARGVLDELGGDIDAALQEVRAVSHGIAPPLLVEKGLPDALSAVAGRAALRVTVHADAISRYPPHIETAVYFCCLEALQNIEKHAGARATADIALSDDGTALAFVVADDGEGFDPEKVRVGAGFRNIQERIEELGGSATFAGRVGGGAEVRGSIPLAA